MSSQPPAFGAAMRPVALPHVPVARTMRQGIGVTQIVRI